MIAWRSRRRCTRHDQFDHQVHDAVRHNDDLAQGQSFQTTRRSRRRCGRTICSTTSAVDAPAGARISPRRLPLICTGKVRLLVFGPTGGLPTSGQGAVATIPGLPQAWPSTPQPGAARKAPISRAIAESASCVGRRAVSWLARAGLQRGDELVEPRHAAVEPKSLDCFTHRLDRAVGGSRRRTWAASLSGNGSSSEGGTILKLLPHAIDQPPGALRSSCGPLYVAFRRRVRQDEQADGVDTPGVGDVRRERRRCVSTSTS